MYTFNRNFCQACCNKRGGKPPCLTIRMMPRPGVLLASEEAEALGADCSFRASWEEIVRYSQNVPHEGIEPGQTTTELKNIAAKTAEYKKRNNGQTPPPEFCNVLVGAPTSHNNNVSYIMPQTRRRMTFLRRMTTDAEFNQWWAEFQNAGLVTPVGQFSTNDRISLAVEFAFRPGVMGEEVRKAWMELMNPLVLPIVVGVFVLLALTPAKAVVIVKNCLMGLGLATQTFGYAQHLAEFVVYAAGAQSRDDIDKAGRSLAKLLAAIFRDGSLALVAEFMAAFKRGAASWKEAAAKGEAAAAQGATAATVAGQAGMQVWHVRGWIAWAARTRSLVVLRACNPKGLPRHFDELVTGKCVDVKWRTAASGPNQGLVVVPHANGMHRLKVVEEIQKLKKLGYTFKPNRKGGMPEAGDMLIGPDGRAFCADVDKMGIYLVDGGRARPHPEWLEYNDNPSLRERLQRLIYGGGPRMDQHGCQDFWQVGVTADGKPIMGRLPSPGEKFLVVEPNGQSSILDVPQLRDLYSKYKIVWPYN